MTLHSKTLRNHMCIEHVHCDFFEKHFTLPIELKSRPSYALDAENALHYPRFCPKSYFVNLKTLV